MLRKASLPIMAASIVSFTFLSLCLAGPKPPKADPPDASVVPKGAGNDDVVASAQGASMILGTFVGNFGKHRITVCLQNLLGQSVNGYSVVAGNVRAFSGSLVDNPRAFEVHAKEPGDDKLDGSFVFEFRPDIGHLTGTWTPHDPHLANVDFDLPRRNFKYDPRLGSYPQASIRLLKTKDVENIRPEDLRIMRNEIYARHGYTFRLEDMRDYFDRQDWYMPISMNVSTQLTPVEEKNEALIKHYEDYGNEHYDAFGR